MKTKYWIGFLAFALVLSLALGLWLLRPRPSGNRVTVVQDGQVTMVLDLDQNQTLTFTGKNGGSNTVQIKDGKVAVTQASCPDHICMSMGWKNSGPPIACLPNGLILRFEMEEALDGVTW